MDYYPNVGKDLLTELINSDYAFLVLDFGVLSAQSIDDFYRCNRKFIIGSLAPWKRDNFFHFLKKNITKNIKDSFYYLLQNGCKESAREFSKDANIPFYNLIFVPFLENPFHITNNEFSFLERLL